MDRSEAKGHRLRSKQDQWRRYRNAGLVKGWNSPRRTCLGWAGCARPQGRRRSGEVSGLPGSVVAPAVTGGPAEQRLHLGAVEGRPRILVIAREAVVAVVILSHQLAQSPLRPGIGRRDQAHLVATARLFQRRAAGCPDVAGVDVAPEVCLAEARVVPLVLKPVVAVGSDDIIDAQPYPGRLRVADRDRVRDHLADVLAQGVGIRGRMPLGLIERDLCGNCALGQQTGRHLTRGVNDPRNPEIARRLHEVVGAQHVVVKDVDLRLTARGGMRRQMTDPLRAELEERIVDLARVRQVYPAELSWQLQLWSADEVEVHDLMANLRQETDNPPSGLARSSCHDDSHLEDSRPSPCSSGLHARRPRDSQMKISMTTGVRCEASRTSGVCDPSGDALTFPVGGVTSGPGCSASACAGPSFGAGLSLRRRSTSATQTGIASRICTSEWLSMTRSRDGTAPLRGAGGDDRAGAPFANPRPGDQAMAA